MATNQRPQVSASTTELHDMLCRSLGREMIARVDQGRDTVTISIDSAVVRKLIAILTPDGDL